MELNHVRRGAGEPLVLVRLVPLPGLGHAPCWDDPELVSQTVLEGTVRAG